MKPGPKPRSALERWFEKVVVTAAGCWEWIGARDPNGYGRFAPEGTKTVLAHRFGYEALADPFLTASALHHHCKNTACVRPAHLEPVSSTDHALIERDLRVECRNGHRWTPQNTYTEADGSRQCRTCRRIARRRAYVRANATAR